VAATVSEIEGVYRTRYPAFLRAACAITGEQSRAADAVQDGFARALASRTTFRGDGPLEGWLWRIVVNAARAARPREDAELPDEPDLRGDDAADDSDPYGVHAWLASRPERERLVVFLRYFADLDYRAIAVALEIEVGTVSATLHAAHSALRRTLEEARR
jgi:RNA polymerase sigma factor (sigma-70 family)